MDYLACEKTCALEKQWWRQATIQWQIGGSCFHFLLPFFRIRNYNCIMLE
jgi:hypothetical protein